jgi:hypothetical protein
MSSSTQSPILRLLDFVDEIASGKEKARANIFVLFAYAMFGCFSMVVWRHFSDQDFSYLCTFAGLCQMLAFYLLLHKMKVTQSAAGVSSRSLQVYVLAFCFRLSSTLVKNGYLPVDRSGDWVYQAADIASLLLCFQLLFFCHKRYRSSYQAELDTFPIFKLVPACVLLGCAFHGQLNHSPFFDKTWTIGMWLDAVAMLPQLWMLALKGGEVEALTSNYVALTFLSRSMTWFFWYTGYAELAPKDGGLNVVGIIIMAGQSLQLLISADFMYHYFAWQSSKCTSRMGCVPICGEPTDSMMMPDMPEFDFELEF